MSRQFNLEVLFGKRIEFCLICQWRLYFFGVILRKRLLAFFFLYFLSVTGKLFYSNCCQCAVLPRCAPKPRPCAYVRGRKTRSSRLVCLFCASCIVLHLSLWTLGTTGLSAGTQGSLVLLMPPCSLPFQQATASSSLRRSKPSSSRPTARRLPRPRPPRSRGRRSSCRRSRRRSTRRAASPRSPTPRRPRSPPPTAAPRRPRAPSSRGPASPPRPAAPWLPRPAGPTPTHAAVPLSGRRGTPSPGPATAKEVPEDSDWHVRFHPDRLQSF